jgi:hypothetical protein
MNTKIQIGDLVKIIDDGEIYPDYEEAAVAMGLKNWISERLGSTQNRYDLNEYTVIGMFPPQNIFGITNEIEDFVIDGKGIQLIAKSKKLPLIPEEAKGPQLFDINNLYPYRLKKERKNEDKNKDRRYSKNYR